MAEKQAHEDNIIDENSYRQDIANQLFDSLLKRACDELLQEEYEQDCKACAQVDLPKALDDRISAMLTEAKKQEPKATRRTFAHTTLHRVAVAFLCVTVLSAVIMPNVNAWRVRFQNLFLDTGDTFTAVKGSLDDTDSIAESAIPTPRYIPSRYRLVEFDNGGGKAYLLFQNTKQASLVLEISKNESTEFILFAAESSPIRINDMEGYSIHSEGINALIWERGEYVYFLNGAVSEEELLTMAKSLEY